MLRNICKKQLEVFVGIQLVCVGVSARLCRMALALAPLPDSMMKYFLRSTSNVRLACSLSCCPWGYFHDQGISEGAVPGRY